MSAGLPAGRVVAKVQRHRTWCALWAPAAWCSCGGVDVVELVEWWAAAARRRAS